MGLELVAHLADQDDGGGVAALLAALLGQLLSLIHILEDHKTELVYKPMYLMRFYNRDLDEEKYKVMDSLSGDLEDLVLE